MYIVFAMMTVFFAATLSLNFESEMMHNVRSEKIQRKNVQNYYVLRDVAQVTAQAINSAKSFGTTGVCPAGTRSSNVFGSTPSCWPFIGSSSSCFRVGSGAIGVSNGGDADSTEGSVICIKSKDSAGLTQNQFESVAFLKRLVLGENLAHANDFAQHGQFTGMTTMKMEKGNGLTNQRGEVEMLIRPSASSATDANTNFINCNFGFTNCYSVSFCLNGSASCSTDDTVVQTFAMRKF